MLKFSGFPSSIERNSENFSKTNYKQILSLSMNPRIYVHYTRAKLHFPFNRKSETTSTLPWSRIPPRPLIEWEISEEFYSYRQIVAYLVLYRPENSSRNTLGPSSSEVSHSMRGLGRTWPYSCNYEVYDILGARER